MLAWRMSMKGRERIRSSFCSAFWSGSTMVFLGLRPALFAPWRTCSFSGQFNTRHCLHQGDELYEQPGLVGLFPGRWICFSFRGDRHWTGKFAGAHWIALGHEQRESLHQAGVHRHGSWCQCKAPVAEFSVRDAVETWRAFRKLNRS